MGNLTKCTMKRCIIFTVILFFSIPLSYLLGQTYWAGLMDQVQLCPWMGRERGGMKSCGEECYSRLLELSFELEDLANRVQDSVLNEDIVDSELVGMSERARDVAESAMMELYGEKKSGPVCGEVFKGPEKGWDGECGPEVSNMVTILINLVDSPPEDWWELLGNLTSKLQDLHPGISVIVAIPSDGKLETSSKSVIRVFPKSSNPGTVWNDLISRVSTPYVVLARDVIDFGTKLDSLLRAITSIPGIAVAAGSIRIGDEWEQSCVQRSLAGYVLKYEPGYWHSRYECLFCHYTDSPFLSNTTLLRELFPLDQSLKSSVLFHDLFIRLEEFNFGMVACPDVTFDIRTRKDEPLRKDWLPLANKFQIEKIITPKSKLQFSCAEARLTCKRLLSLTANFLVPECCQAQFSSAMAFWHKMSKLHNFHYKLNAGAVVGAVKMANFLPFDHDGDMDTVSSNHSTIMSLKSEFVEAGFGLWEYEKIVLLDYKIDGGILFLWTPDIKVEAYGNPTILSPRNPPEIEGNVPSLVRIRDAWINTSPNPGLYIRNRYGREVLRHSQGWSVMGLPGSHSEYDPGKFLKCSQPDHQACLNHFPADGSIPYMTD